MNPLDRIRNLLNSLLGSFRPVEVRRENESVPKTTMSGVVRRKDGSTESVGTVSVSEIPPIPMAEAKGIKDMKRTTAPALQCIYCGATEARLTDEHVIPFSLQGNLIIPKGSCDDCQKATSKFELEVARGPLHAVRRQAGFQSRTKHSDERPHRSGTMTDAVTGLTIPIPQQSMPVMFDFPIFPPPRILRGQRGRGVEVVGTEMALFGKATSPAELGKELGAKEITVTTENYRYVSYARLLAKIAYGFAWSEGQVARLANPQGITDCIRGVTDDAGDWVGTLTGPRRRYPMLHRLALHEQDGQLLGEVQLFADTGAPSYGVVLGTLIA